jgi:hypothetical protein
VYLRSIKLNISVEQAQRLEPELRKKYLRATASAVEDRGEIFADLQKTHAGGASSDSNESTTTETTTPTITQDESSESSLN